MNKARMFVRPLTAEERQALERGRKSADPFTLRRSQILLARAARLGPAAIGRVVGCTAQTVRNAIRAFEADGPGCLTAKSHARKDPGRVWGRDHDHDLTDLLHRRPREFGKATSLWTLALVAEVCEEQGWTPGRCRSRPSAKPCSGWASVGSGRTTGSPARAPSMRGKKLGRQT